MAIGTISETAAYSNKRFPSGALRYISFAGDGAYAAGGTADFEASLQGDIGVKDTIIGFIPDIVNSGGYIPSYDPANDKMKIFYCTNNGGAAGPLVEDTTANQSGRTYAGWVILG
jgi:hypothetical protein